MWRLLLVLALLPIVAGLLARQVWWSRVARRHGAVVSGAPPAHEVAAELLRAGAVEGEVAKGILPDVGRARVVLPRERWEARDAASLGVAVQAAGFVLLGEREPAVVAARVRVLRFGAVMPGLALVVALFAVLAARAGVGWAVTGALLVCGLAAFTQLTSIAVELRAAAMGLAALRASRIALSATDRERVEECAKAAAWRRALPLALAWIAVPDPVGGESAGTRGEGG